MKREGLGSRLGFIMLSAGCAIGIGNVWKFPYLVGQNGGGAFVLLYMFFLAIMGLPVLTMEFSIGRGARKSPVKMYQQLEKPGSKWHIHGVFCLMGSVLLMMFYSTVAGWMLLYFLKTAMGKFQGQDVEAVRAVFTDMLEKPGEMVIATAIIVATGFFVCSMGLQNGLERVNKYIMLCLLGIMVILAVNSIFLDGAKEGLKFFLWPDLARMKEIGFGKVVMAAMSQAFFTLSLGIGAMSILGSYIDRERALLGEAVRVAALDTFVAITSGLIIIPACFAYGVEPGAGPSLIFVTLPNIFNNMPNGRLWGSMFFVFMTFAAFSTVLTVFENIMACVMEMTGWTRKEAGRVCCLAIFLLSFPCILGFNILSGVNPLGGNSGIMDLEDFLVSNLFLPLGSLVIVLFCTLRSGWGWEAFTAEANTGKGLKIAGWMRPVMGIVVPILIIVVLFFGLL